MVLNESPQDKVYTRFKRTSVKTLEEKSNVRKRRKD